MNLFILIGYISITIGPGTLITGYTYYFNRLCGPGSQFGEYVQNHEKTTNTMRMRTVGGGITLCPAGNIQDPFYYFSLDNGRQLNRHRWTPLPMHDYIIITIHGMVTHKK